MRNGAVLVISPHFDDAVLSCGLLLSSHPGSCVLTVFGGRPVTYPNPASTWDAAGGFRNHDDVVGLRRLEDMAALKAVNAEQAVLEYCDEQYRSPGHRYPLKTLVRTITNEIRLRQPRLVVAPLGLGHSDHWSASDAALAVRRQTACPDLILYEEQPYRQVPSHMAERISDLHLRGMDLISVLPDLDPDRTNKLNALSCYRSQLRALGWSNLATDSPFVDERYWAVSGPPSVSLGGIVASVRKALQIRG
jgi:LmbE family N-acetylglucosaminyl deacetylase